MLLILLRVNPGFADPLGQPVVADYWQGRWLGTTLHLCAQPAAVAWSPEQALAHCEWQPSTVDVPGFGITQGAYWIALPLEFSGTPEARWLLELAYPLLDQVEFFVFDRGHLQFISDSSDLHGGLLRYRHFVLPLGERRGRVDVLIRMQVNGSTQIPLALWKEADFLAAEAQFLALLGAALGVMLAMMLYNFFIAISGGNRAYYYYAGMVFAMLIVQLCVQGAGERFLGGSHLTWNTLVLPVAIGIVIFFANAFCEEFLQLDARQDPWRWGYRLVRWLALLLALSAAFMPVDQAVMAGVILAIVGSFYSFFLIIRHYQSDDRAAQFFCAGWFFFLVGVLLFAFNKLGVLPRNFYTEHLMLIGAVVELLMLSLALGERINQERTQKEIAQARAISLERKEREAHAIAIRNESLSRKAQEAALNLQQETNALMERKVEERSRALEDINDRLQELTRQDPLTGVRNRRFLNEKLPEEYHRACREGLPLSVIMVDVDHFKQINDQYGHLAGDQCLKTVADLLERMATGPGAVVTRYGGEEFCLLLPGASRMDAVALAEAIRESVANERMRIRGRTLRITVSMGVSSGTPQREGRPEHLLDAADKALYAAKAGGRNRVLSEQTAPEQTALDQAALGQAALGQEGACAS